MERGRGGGEKERGDEGRGEEMWKVERVEEEGRKKGEGGKRGRREEKRNMEG